MALRLELASAARTRPLALASLAALASACVGYLGGDPGGALPAGERGPTARVDPAPRFVGPGPGDEASEPVGADDVALEAGDDGTGDPPPTGRHPGFKLFVTDYGQSPWTGEDLAAAMERYGLGEVGFRGGTSNYGETITVMGEWDWTYYGLRPGDPVGDGSVRDDRDCYGGPEHPSCYASGPATPAEGFARMASYLVDHRPELPPDGIVASFPSSMSQHFSSAMGLHQMIGAECGAGTPNFQALIAFSRGTARQHGWEWFLDYSPWYGRSVRATRAASVGPNEWCPECGHSRSLMRRLLFMGWLGGANYIHDEGGALSYFEELPRGPDGLLRLSETGQVTEELMRFTREHHRGVPFVPICVVLNRHHGIGHSWSQGRTWEHIPWTTGDQDWWTYNVFNQVLWGGGFGDTLYSQSEEQDMVPMQHGWGEMIDVVTEDAPTEVLQQYRVLVLTGPLDGGVIPRIDAALAAGAHVVLGPGLSSWLAYLTPGAGRVYAPGDLATFAAHLRAAYEAAAAPFRVSGPNVTYQIAEVGERAFLLAIYNQRGVRKEIHSTTREVVDHGYDSLVTVERIGSYLESVTELRGDGPTTSSAERATVVVPAGEVAILRIETTPEAP